MDRIQSKNIGQQLMKSTKFIYDKMIIKYTSKTVDMIDQLLVITVHYKKQLS